MVLGMLVVLVAFNFILTALVFWKLYGKSAAERLDAAVEEEQEAIRRSREMDEGFDNLMRFSVRGTDGFGGGE